MSVEPPARVENRILAALSAEEYERMALHLEVVPYKLSEILFHPEDRVEQVYFPNNAIVSLLTELEDGGGLEVGLVGKEGMVGVEVVLGTNEASKVATVQKEGTVMKMSAAKLVEEFRRGGALQALLLRYVDALLVQISQSAACNARHNLPGRLARWLLMYHDRTESDEFSMTHEFMANMLGVRRAGVSTVAEKLQQMGLISYRRGHIKILDRERLEAFACECYPVVKKKFDAYML